MSSDEWKKHDAIFESRHKNEFRNATTRRKLHEDTLALLRSKGH
jgi:hypothetical protein